MHVCNCVNTNVYFATRGRITSQGKPACPMKYPQKFNLNLIFYDI